MAGMASLRRRSLLAACLLCLATAAVAQQPSTRPAAAPEVLLGMRVLAPGEWRAVGSLVTDLREVPYRPVVHRADGTAVAESLVVDVAAKTVLDGRTDAVTLRDLAGAVVWRRVCADVGTECEPAADRRWLGPERIVLPRTAGGVVALRRADGQEAWTVPWRRAALLVVAGELVLATGGEGKDVRFAAWSVANGAKAFEVAGPQAPRALVGGPHGLAVVGADELVVFDSSGPRLFALPVQGDAMVQAALDGWVVLDGGQLRAFDRQGAVRWQRAYPADRFANDDLTIDALGNVLLTRFHRIADDGAELRCFAAADGEPCWRTTLAPLGIDHSKYWHRVQAWPRGDGFVVASHGAGGQWLVELEAATGTTRQRVQFAN